MPTYAFNILLESPFTIHPLLIHTTTSSLKSYCIATPLSQSFYIETNTNRTFYKCQLFFPKKTQLVFHQVSCFSHNLYNRLGRFFHCLNRNKLILSVKIFTSSKQIRRRDSHKRYF